VLFNSKGRVSRKDVSLDRSTFLFEEGVVWLLRVAVSVSRLEADPVTVDVITTLLVLGEPVSLLVQNSNELVQLLFGDGLLEGRRVDRSKLRAHSLGEDCALGGDHECSHTDGGVGGEKTRTALLECDL